jgi:predicted ArsR family transcriptional regulator
LERERVTVQEAARQLGITESAVRKRVQRGMLRHDKEADGRLYVYLGTRDKDRDQVRDSSYDMLVRRLENENEFLRRELERKDTILLNMTEAMKAIGPGEARREDAPESPEPRSDRDTTPPEGPGEPETASKRPWWRRWLG